MSARISLPANEFALYEMKYGRKAETLDSEQIATFEKGYVGKKVRLAVYETGRFVGTPGGIPLRLMPQCVGYHFETSLVVLSERDTETKRPKGQSTNK